MQTFLPLPDFVESAKVLDRQRLGKQRLEAYQILNALKNPEYGWQNHPAVRMWRANRPALAIYGLVMCTEWRDRGYLDTMSLRILDEHLIPMLQDQVRTLDYPHWFGSEEFHASHRSNLLRKDPDHYSQFEWTEGPDIEYVWPVD